MQFQTIQAQNGTAADLSKGSGAAGDPEAALDVAADTLGTGVFDWKVSGRDIERMQDAYSSLDADGKNELVAGLSDEQLGNWFSGINTAGGGLGESAKADFLEDLATDLDASNLVRVVDNMNYAGDGELFGTAIGDHASEATAVEVVDRLGPSFLDFANGNRVGANSTTEDVAARVVAALDTPTAIRSALETLDPAEREALAKNTYPNGAHASEAFDGMIDAVSRSGSVELRTEFFEHLGTLSEPRSAADVPYLDEVYDGMKKLIEPDPVGTVDILSRSALGTPALVTYLELGVARGDNSHIGELGEIIRGGDSIPGDVGATDIERFSHDFNGKVDGGYTNANRAGLFTGALIKATENVDLDEQARTDLTVALLSGGVVAVTGGNELVAAGVTVTPQVVKILDGAAGERADFVQAMIDASVPRDADGDLPPADSAARAAFVDGVSEVTDLP